jgi:hypothetical protein
VALAAWRSVEISFMGLSVNLAQFRKFPTSPGAPRLRNVKTRPRSRPSESSARSMLNCREMRKDLLLLEPPVAAALLIRQDLFEALFDLVFKP